MDVLIRDATSADVEGIAGFDHEARSLGRDGMLGERMLRAPVCLVAERREGTVIAYAALDYSFYGNGFVSRLVVAEHQRRRGTGQALLKAIAARCETPKLFTSTNESNDVMQRLLTRMGFVPSGRIDNLDPGDPEVVYFLAVGDRAAY